MSAAEALTTEEATEENGFPPLSSTADPPRKPGTFTSETGKEARKRRGPGARKAAPNPPSDASIEASLRKAASTDPRAAETLIRWLQRPRLVATEDNLDALSLEELERLHEGLRALCSMGGERVGAAVRALLERT